MGVALSPPVSVDSIGSSVVSADENPTSLALLNLVVVDELA